MGVAGLWDILKPAAKTRSVTELAVTEGFQANPNGLRGYRLGIDASIWFFHAEYGKEGENPVLRTLFFRCATLLKSPFLPLFVFDGPKRPDFKRGKRINKTGNKLIPGMKRLIEAFGFEWRTAPGEAEAELAYLNRIGVIDGILSDDVDNFLFGALTVIRNQSNNLSGNKSNPILNSEGRDDKMHTRVFSSQDIRDHPDIQLTRGGLILIGLLSGGDYETGVEGCGPSISHALARCGFGDSLYDAARTLSREDLAAFLDNWREELRVEIKTNSKGFMARKAPNVSKNLPETFPNIDVLLSYVKPVTSESLGHEGGNPQITWSKEANVAALASACELFFEWGYKEAIIKRFRSVIWPGAVLRILRRAVLYVDTFPSVSSIPYKQVRRTDDDENGYGTPSKMIAKHFSALDLNSENEFDHQKPEEPRLIISISRERMHASVDGLPEYRLEVSPGQLVDIAISGLQGLRQPEGPNEWVSDEEEDSDDDGGRKKRGKPKEPIDPKSNLRLWMPMCMVDPVETGLVRSFRESQERKNRKKTKSTTKKATPKQGHVENSSLRKNQSTKSKDSPTSSHPVHQTTLPPYISTEILSTTPPRLTPRPFPVDLVHLRQEEEESSGDEGELPTWVIPTEDNPLGRPTIRDSSNTKVNSAPKSTSNRKIKIAKSRTGRGNDPSKKSTSGPPPSLRQVEDTLELSDSEDELPADIYRTMQPLKSGRHTTSSKITGYLSLSDQSDGENFSVKSVSPSKRKKFVETKQQGNRTIQTTLSSHTGRSHGKKPETSDSQDNTTYSQGVRKSPRKAHTHVSIRHSKDPSQSQKEVITISDNDIESGYTGVSRPKVTPLQLARNRANEVPVSSRPKPPMTCEIIELLED